MVGLETRDQVTPQTVAPSAVVWINGRQAMVATMSHDGRTSTSWIRRGWLPKRRYLTAVVRLIGDRQRVVILGPSSIRLALEREYVAIFRRPDRLVEVDPTGAVDQQELLDRLRTLCA
jgi:hypothetical protein